MSSHRFVAGAALALAALVPAAPIVATPSPTVAAESERCLTPEERRAKVAAKTVVPLSRAIKAARVRRAEVVRASLCERAGRLVYVLTVLPRDGKVARVSVDAGSGAVIGR